MLARTRGSPAVGERIALDPLPGGDGFGLVLVARGAGGAWLARPDVEVPVEEALARVGRVPLPGYVRGGVADAADVERYQTVFARAAGSAAAPTAGLHFTEDLLRRLAERGVARATVTLHVGLDTFRTTTVRTLETAAWHGVVASWEGSTDLFIRPGFRFRAVDALVTNFHLPRTTLLVLVSTFASRSIIRRAYDEAIRERYRFLSYGDAMLIVP